MRTLIITLFCFVAACSSALAHKDRIEHPRTLTVSFKTGESVTFTISNATVTALSVRIGSSVHSVPQSECAKLHDIRFDSTKLLWNGSYETSVAADYFYIEFDMGLETERAFGELPRVQVMFRGGKFSETSVTKKISEGTWQDSKL